MTKPRPTDGAPMRLLLDLTPLEAADVLFELVLTSGEVRERAAAIARERRRVCGREVAEDAA